MSLTFLGAGLLIGLTALAVPVLVHLISRRRARRVRFAAIEFVLRSQRRTARSIRLRQFLLLLVRSLFIAAVALAVAQPVLVEETAARTSNAPIAVALVVDASASMQATLDGKSAFVRALRRARDVIDDLPNDTPVAIVRCASPSSDALSPPTFDRGAALAALDALEPGFTTSDLSACAAHAGTLLMRVPGDGERRVVVLSDLAAHAMGTAAGRAGDGVVIAWVQVMPEDAVVPNHAITTVSAEPGGGGDGQAVTVGFEVARFGGAPQRIPADLLMEGKRLARVTVDAKPGQVWRGAFTHPFDDTGSRAPNVSIVLDDDALDADNRVELPVDLPRPIRVLIVDGAPQPIPFRDEVFYLESALSQVKASRARLVIEVIGADALNAGKLAETRVVVLANVARLTSEAAAALIEFVKAGGGLLISMGDQIDVSWANTALAPVLPGRLRGAKGLALLDNADVAEKLGLTRFATDHPAFTGLTGGEGGGLAGLSRVETTTLMLLEPQADAPREVLAWFTNQAPALLERRAGAGRVLLLATTIDRDWSDLAIRPGFLPLMQQSLAYLAGALDGGGLRLIEVGGARDIAVPRGPARLEVRPPGLPPVDIEGEALAADGGLRVRVPFDRTTVPGLYRVFVQREGGDLRELPLERFTVLIPRAESDLTRADDALLASATPEGARQTRAGDEDSTPLWPWLLITAALLMAVETLVLRWRGTL